jgi:hypothetical protein
MLQCEYFGVKGGKCEFAAIANLMGACSGSGPPTGGHNAFPFCAAAVRFEPKLTDVEQRSNGTMCHFRSLVDAAANSNFEPEPASLKVPGMYSIMPRRGCACEVS